MGENKGNKGCLGNGTPSVDLDQKKMQQNKV